MRSSAILREQNTLSCQLNLNSSLWNCCSFTVSFNSTVHILLLVEIHTLMCYSGFNQQIVPFNSLELQSHRGRKTEITLKQLTFISV